MEKASGSWHRVRRQTVEREVTACSGPDETQSGLYMAMFALYSSTRGKLSITLGSGSCSDSDILSVRPPAALRQVTSSFSRLQMAVLPQCEVGAKHQRLLIMTH